MTANCNKLSIISKKFLTTISDAWQADLSCSLITILILQTSPAFYWLFFLIHLAFCGILSPLSIVSGSLRKANSHPCEKNDFQHVMKRATSCFRKIIHTTWYCVISVEKISNNLASLYLADSVLSDIFSTDDVSTDDVFGFIAHRGYTLLHTLNGT